MRPAAGRAAGAGLRGWRRSSGRETIHASGRPYAACVGLVIEEFAAAPVLRGIVGRAADYHERSRPVRRLEGPFVGVVLIINLGPEIEIDGRPTGSFVAGVWDRPTITGHFGEQA